MRKSRQTLFIGYALAVAAALGIWVPAAAQSANSMTCLNGLTCLDQGWSDEQRNWWYRTTQGSRLLPLAWMLSLELPDGSGKFIADANMARLGYLPEPISGDNPYGLPVGFAVDEDKTAGADLMCDTFPAMCASGAMRKPWVGMNCSACHTNDIQIGSRRLRIEGAPTLADFQGLEELLLKSLKATSDNPEKFDRFSTGVLGAVSDSIARSDLKLQLLEQIEWQEKLAKQNAAPKVRYGHARLDAQGHILNKVALTTLVNQPVSIRADAPASYPHVWNTSQQNKIQWNGIASNTVRINFFGLQTDVGALIRNASEVIGVFAHIETDNTKAWWGYKSSARVDKLIGLERQLATLQSPQWPEDLLGALDGARVARGDAIFDRLQCGTCHASLAPEDVTSKMTEVMSDIKGQRTDIFLACNTFLHSSNAGNFDNQKVFAFFGPRILPRDKTRYMLINSTVGTINGKLDELAGSIFSDIAPLSPSVSRALGDETDKYLPGVTDRTKKSNAEQCLTAKDNNEKDVEILAYKARSLNGIWATAPYLHNGSVPTLYDLMNITNLRLHEDDPQPALTDDQKRPDVFSVGTRIFDAANVGFDTKPTAPGNVFEFRVFDAQNEPIPGNYNTGHDYGTFSLSRDEKLDLVEYLKSL